MKRLLEVLQTAYPDNPDLSIQQARLALAQDKPEEAVKAYQEAVRRIPNADLVGQLALAQWQAGQREASFQTMQGWLVDHPDDVKVRYNLANLFLAAGRHEEAREAFSIVIKAHPTHPVALSNLALLTRETDPGKAPSTVRRRLYAIRRKFEQRQRDLDAFAYVVSLSSRTFVYTGMLLATQLRDFYPDAFTTGSCSCCARSHVSTRAK